MKGLCDGWDIPPHVMGIEESQYIMNDLCLCDNCYEIRAQDRLHFEEVYDHDPKDPYNLPAPAEEG